MIDIALLVWAFMGPGVGFGLAWLVLMSRPRPWPTESEVHVVTPDEVSAPSDLVSLVGELDRARHHGGSE